MADTYWDGQVEALERRLRAVAELPFQARGQSHRRAHDGISGRDVLLNPARAARTRPPRDDRGQEGCHYCEGRTPPTLFYVPDQQGTPGCGGSEAAAVPALPRIEDETLTLDVARAMVESGRGDTWSLLDRLGRAEHVDARERTVPAVHPRERWLARAFLNATPLVVDPHSEANGFVIGVAPAWHDADIVWCGAAAPGSPSAPAGGSIARELPRPVLAAVVTSWALLEAWADSRGLVGVPFVNGGKSPASGQSLPCFHAQFYALGPSDQPPLYELLSRRRTRECAVCEIVRDPSLRIATVGDIHIAAHPAPEREATLIVAPEGDVCALRLLPTMSDFAAALSVAARCLCGLLGGPTAYNIAVRTGSSVGHLHAELVPRSGVGVRAGFEFATGFSVLARDPVVVAAECRQYAASPASAGPAVSAGPGAG